MNETNFQTVSGQTLQNLSEAVKHMEQNPLDMFVYEIDESKSVVNIWTLEGAKRELQSAKL